MNSEVDASLINFELTHPEETVRRHGIEGCLISPTRKGVLILERIRSNQKSDELPILKGSLRMPPHSE